MNSPKKLNYETRPLKFTERKMLLASLLKICNHFKGEYQYIGFGGISFTDFKLFHKELHLDKLISIEGGEFTIEKLRFNAPFSFIQIIKDFSTNALQNIDLSVKSLVWLDYDETLDNYMFQDIKLLFSKLPEGSIYLITCNRELKSKETGKEYSVSEFEEKFQNLVPFGIKNIDFTGQQNYKTIRKMLLSLIKETISDRNNSQNEQLVFNQLFNITYQENRGAKMFTLGGVISKSKFDLNKLDIDKLSFINIDETAYNLKIPNLTLKEIDLINDYFDDEQELLSKSIIEKHDIDKYKKTYRYLPKFFDVRF
ncbi:MAG: O-methyltransferase [Weeksellaceae bacterium]